MICPKCAVPLTCKYYKGMMEVDYCPSCRGMWLDFNELDRLEDVVFDEDQFKGSLIHREMDVDCACPVCGGKLREFQYRLYDLKLDLCPQNHGFWLDAGEDERVMEIMRLRATDVSRKRGAKSEWKEIIAGLHHFFKQGF